MDYLMNLKVDSNHYNLVSTDACINNLLIQTCTKFARLKNHTN